MSNSRTDIDRDTQRKTATGPLWKRLLWLIAIWGMSVAALGLVAYVIRLWLT